MSSLQDIADAKVQAAVNRRLDALTPTIVSITQEMNARGLLHSSSKAAAISAVCISLFDEIRDAMKTEYGMVLDNAFWPTEPLGDQLISKASCHFDAVINRAQGEIKSASQSLMRKDTYKELCSEVTQARDRTLIDLSLFIDGHSKIPMRKKIMRTMIYLPKFILGLIKQ